ncbi:hypothetical protein D9758_008069 [Tetrapyrgos nigripes]|uniref:Uncharacterized protein n=1 Tax=Tetrapyrgos nigripes TaxID=182062 RepID=A0A8H5D242_9AGAR|nr:hypothetical protein D9758_008069 [Tetrapyrgos nigripes]
MATSTSTIITPYLPVELIHLIILTFWNTPSTSLSSKDRATFMKSSLLVSSTWQAVFLEIVSRDFYIPDTDYAHKLLDALKDHHLLPFKSTTLSPESSPMTTLVNILPTRCSRITFQYTQTVHKISRSVILDCKPLSSESFCSPSCTSPSCSSMTRARVQLAYRILQTDDKLCCSIAATGSELDHLTHKREQWRRAIQARTTKDAREALNLHPIHANSSFVRRVLHFVSGGNTTRLVRLKRPCDIDTSMELDLQDQLDWLLDIQRKQELSEDQELEKGFLEKWIWLIGEEKEVTLTDLRVN